MARLELQDLNREAETLRVRLGKGKKDRILPVGSAAFHWCERYLEEVRPKLEIDQAETALFLTGYGAGLSSQRIGRIDPQIPSRGRSGEGRNTLAAAHLRPSLARRRS